MSADFAISRGTAGAASREARSVAMEELAPEAVGVTAGLGAAREKGL